MSDLLKLAELYDQHAVRLAGLAHNHARSVDIQLTQAAAHCFTIAAALRARSEAAAVGGR